MTRTISSVHAWLFAASLLAAAPAQGPNVRYEFLRRLSELEREWQAPVDAEVRAKAFRKAKSEWNKWGRILALAADLAQAPGEEGRNG